MMKDHFSEAVRAGRILHEESPWVYFAQPDASVIYWKEGTEPPPRMMELLPPDLYRDLYLGPRRRLWMRLANWTDSLGMVVLFGLWFLSALCGWIGRRFRGGSDGNES